MQIQLEEMEEGAERLACGLGLVACEAAPPGAPDPSAVSIPDYDFFASRAARR